MHGRGRASRAAEASEPAEVQEARRAKYKKYLDASSALCALISSSETLALTPKDALKCDALLTANPDFHTLWNVRRARLLEQQRADPTQNEILLQGELELTKTQLVEKNSKSYGAWYHRRWAVEVFRAAESVLTSELALCDLMLSKDARNFHCWSYRSWIASQRGLTWEDALKKSTELIEENFSNYSAWHLRVSALASASEATLSEQFSLVHNAVYTEPSDQSAWMFYRWLLGKTCPLSPDRAAAERAVVADLLEEEGDAKWPLLALMQLVSVDSEKSLENAETRRELEDLSERLMTVDPLHRGFYVFLRDKARDLARNDLGEWRLVLLGT